MSATGTRLLAISVAGALIVAGACNGRPNPAGPDAVGAAGSTDLRNPGPTVTYTGQGWVLDGSNWILKDELCGVSNGAEQDGPYLLWIFTATGAASATITGPFGTAGATATVNMIQTSNGTFKYVSGYFDYADLVPGVVSATYSGSAKNAQLTISHGCMPYTAGAWCSPGFWRNAQPEAWAYIGVSPSAAFNTNVYSVWYGATFSVNPTLMTVLSDPTTYSGPPLAGTSGYALNAYNATAAFLTQSLPTYDFAMSSVGVPDSCPIDHHGHLK